MGCHIGKKNAYQLYKGSKSFEKKVKKGVIRRKIIRSKKAPAVYQHCNFGGYKKVLHHSTNWVKKLGIRNDDLSTITFITAESRGRFVARQRSSALCTTRCSVASP